MIRLLSLCCIGAAPKTESKVQARALAITGVSHQPVAAGFSGSLHAVLTCSCRSVCNSFASFKVNSAVQFLTDYDYSFVPLYPSDQS